MFKTRLCRLRYVKNIIFSYLQPSLKFSLPKEKRYFSNFVCRKKTCQKQDHGTPYLLSCYVFRADLSVRSLSLSLCRSKRTYYIRTQYWCTVVVHDLKSLQLLTNENQTHKVGSK